MKIKNYLDFLNETVNHDKVDDLMQKVRDRFDEEEVASMLDEEILNWVDSDWEDDGDYDSEYDWYMDHSNSEAEDVVIDQIINSVDDGNISIDDSIELKQQIAGEYGLRI